MMCPGTLFGSGVIVITWVQMARKIKVWDSRDIHIQNNNVTFLIHLLRPEWSHFPRNPRQSTQDPGLREMARTGERGWWQRSKLSLEPRSLCLQPGEELLWERFSLGLGIPNLFPSTGAFLYDAGAASAMDHYSQQISQAGPACNFTLVRLGFPDTPQRMFSLVTQPPFSHPQEWKTMCCVLNVFKAIRWSWEALQGRSCAGNYNIPPLNTLP